MTEIILTEDIINNFLHHGEQDYPFECCGFILGHFTNQKSIGTEYIAVPNIKKENRYSVDYVSNAVYRDGQILPFYRVVKEYNNSDGKKNGKWNYYNKSGNLIKTENYNEGLLHGNFKLFFDDGITEKLIGKYENNRRTETWFWFFNIDKKSSHKISYSQ